MNAMLNRKALILDDEACMGTLFSVLMDYLNWNVDVALSPEQGLQLLQAGSYSVLITDLHLGAESGLDFIRDIRQQGYVLPAIVMSGDGYELASVSRKDLNIRAFLEKPFDLSQLRSVLAMTAIGPLSSSPQQVASSRHKMAP